MELHELAAIVAELLAKTGRRIVLAESCTAGLIAATLGSVPGISKHLCGSAVVYREQTKVAWLGVNEATLAEFTAVSGQTTVEIARGVLKSTAEADISLGITGHLGPNSPEQDGVIYLALCQKSDSSESIECMQLESSSRSDRQAEATSLALTFLRNALALGCVEG